MSRQSAQAAVSGSTSVDKALEICEALNDRATGLSVSALARALDVPPPTVRRLLSLLKRHGAEVGDLAGRPFERRRVISDL